MKKQLFLLIPLIFVLCGCTEIKGNTNTISVADVTDREQAILHMNTDHAFMFDYNVSDEYKEATVWVEKYEAGKLADHPVSSISTSAKTEGTIIFSIQRPIQEFNKTVLNLSIGDKEGSGSVQNIDVQPEDFNKMGAISSTFSGDAKSVEDENVLATICYSKENEMGTITSAFYDEPEAHLDELADYDLVYVLKSHFKK
ncbi:hypothetical protein PGH26_07000 [Sporosarcina jeotgali]|uniref:Lipoprotein n=1 Tax=Sporosarcina jeotgali TaxID=3020056 RepID=A0ABZ0L186_9BACL|nr:hypothetical protein [Sporosarcina sp. B2O-1]WOV85678.1 hypothetical protein PGH26_07000 [Sporosarcina sp. B2O-1]